MKILGIGKNYVENKEEIKAIKNGQQIIFSKPESSLVTDNKDVVYPDFTKSIVYEVELVIKIGKSGKNIQFSEAESYISEIAVGIDYTAKDIITSYQEIQGPWDLAKGFDGAAPVSNFIPVAKFPDLKNINFNLKINGKQAQVGNNSYMIYNFAEIIEYVSKFMTLEPGDLIYTGTPALGIGEILKGDHLQASIEKELLLDFKMI